jgi:hypothetical protein
MVAPCSAAMAVRSLTAMAGFRSAWARIGLPQSPDSDGSAQPARATNRLSRPATALWAEIGLLACAVARNDSDGGRACHGYHAGADSAGGRARHGYHDSDGPGQAAGHHDGGKLVMATMCPGVASASGSWGHGADDKTWMLPTGNPI